MPVRPLPVLQHWDCGCCGNCCREYHVFLSAEERSRFESQGWDQDPRMAGLTLVVNQGKAGPRLNHRPDGSCVFLSDQNRCLIHERFGAQAKPLACRLYPFVLVPAGDHWRVSLRFPCPAAAADQGRPLPAHQSELELLANELAQQAGRGPVGEDPPPLQPGQTVAWADLLRFVQALVALLQDRSDPFERRMRKCLALAKFCRQAKFDQVKGGRLTEFLKLVTAGLEEDVPADPKSIPSPSLLGRLLFRQAAGVYSRKDLGPNRNLEQRRLQLLAAGWRFARGSGRVPRVHRWIPETDFTRGEIPAGPLPKAADEVLERYYSVKVSSLQFCGQAQFGLPLWEGLESLALTLPVICWLVRLLEAVPREEAVTRAVAIIDRNFAYNQVLGTRRQLLAIRILSSRSQLERLVAWYAR